MGIAKRTPLNPTGDFYVEADMCTGCMAPHGEAPELMGDDAEIGCYFKRQPETEEEVEQAIQAIYFSCVEALRYAGNDPSIIARLRDVGCAHQVDNLD